MISRLIKFGSFIFMVIHKKITKMFVPCRFCTEYRYPVAGQYVKREATVNIIKQQSKNIVPINSCRTSICVCAYTNSHGLVFDIAYKYRPTVMIYYIERLRMGYIDDEIRLLNNYYFLKADPKHNVV